MAARKAKRSLRLISTFALRRADAKGKRHDHAPGEHFEAVDRAQFEDLVAKGWARPAVEEPPESATSGDGGDGDGVVVRIAAPLQEPKFHQQVEDLVRELAEHLQEGQTLRHESLVEAVDLAAREHGLEPGQAALVLPTGDVEPAAGTRVTIDRVEFE